MEQDTGDDFAMVNVIHFYDRPLQVEGVEPGETSSQVLDSTCSTCTLRCSPVIIQFISVQLSQP